MQSIFFTPQTKSDAPSDEMRNTPGIDVPPVTKRDQLSRER
jgi:hypothetical protein